MFGSKAKRCRVYEAGNNAAEQRERTEDGEGEVVPINDESGAAQDADKDGDDERRDGRRVLYEDEIGSLYAEQQQRQELHELHERLDERQRHVGDTRRPHAVLPQLHDPYPLRLEHALRWTRA